MRISDWSSDVCSSDLNSSNSNRLRELAESRGTPSYLIDGAQDIQPQWLEGKKRVGVTAGASAPEVLVKDVITRLKLCGGLEVEELAGREEHVVFSLPTALRRATHSTGDS